jgi:hypothetical protein
MILEKIKHFIISLIMYFRELISPPTDIHYSEIPIIINNFNRLEYLKILLNGLEKRNYKNIYILDNQSSYPPLVEFYKTTKHTVLFLDNNYGFRALWKSKLYKQFLGEFFVYTDPDLEILDACPDNFLEIFRNKLTRRKLASKIGFSLKIDDLPDHYSQKQKVIDWEKKFYNKPTRDNAFFRAPVDTTFSLYRPFSFKHIRSPYSESYRAAAPYQMRHLPWYIDDNNISKEDQFYIKTINKSSTWFQGIEASE